MFDKTENKSTNIIRDFPKTRVFRSQAIKLVLLLNESSELSVSCLKYNHAHAICINLQYKEEMIWSFESAEERDEVFDKLMWELRRFYEDFESDE